MKEATGELNMTVVTGVAIAAVGAFFYAFVWPNIKAGLMKNTCNNVCPGGVSSVTKEGENYSCNCTEGGAIKIDKDGNITEEQQQ